MDPGFNNVIEFRHESWWQPAVARQLKAEGIAFCGISYPDLPEQVMKTAPTVYYRFHGIPQLYLSPYNIRTLRTVTEQISCYRGVRDVYIYFNNDIDVAAIDNARQVRRLVNHLHPRSSQRQVSTTKSSRSPGTKRSTK